MSILLVGFSLWLVALIVVVRLAILGGRELRAGHAWAMAGLLILAGAILFRPHEDTFGGEDAGAYLNSSITYLREGRLDFVDPLLSRVPAAVRPDFLYGHEFYGTTPDVCLWVKDMGRAIVGVHFQPAYPLMMAAAAKIAGAHAILYVIPLATLFAALALGALALQLIGPPGALLSALFYLGSPMVLWHGRCARPELIASFLLLSGFALLLHAWRRPRWAAWPDLLLAAVCIALAPFFHITAWLVVIPLGVIASLIAASGRDDFLLYPAVAVAGLGCFVYQTLAITDIYGIGRFMTPVLARPVLLAVGIVAAFAVLAAAGALARRWRARRQTAATATPVFGGLVPWLVGAVAAAVYLGLYFATPAVESRQAPAAPIYHYIYPTDLRVAAKMISRPVALLGLAGLAILLGFHIRRRSEALAVAFALVPATLLIGNMYDFFMTRYMLVAIAPLLALSLAALAALASRLGVWPGAATLAAAATIACAQLHNRTHLVTITEHEGFLRFLAPYAREVQGRNGILLCEYSRVYAPLRHYFGVSALPLDNQTRFDYRAGLEAWERIVRESPNQPAYFLTPFQPPLSDRFVFRPVLKREFADVRLRQERYRLPTDFGIYALPLTLYTMELTDAARPLPAGPFTYAFDAGNMGLVGFANLRAERADIPALPVPPGEWRTPALPPAPDGSSSPELRLFFLGAGKSPAAPTLRPRGGMTADALRWRGLPYGWWLLQGPAAGLPANAPLSLVSPQRMALADWRLLADGGADAGAPPPSAPGMERVSLQVKARWSRAESRMVLPLPDAPKADILLFFTAPAAEKARPRKITLETATGETAAHTVPGGRWMWESWRLACGPARGAPAWVTIRTDPPWDSRVRGFPPDLGILIAAVAVLPVE